MSTYYAILCTECKEMVDFVSKNTPDRWNLMYQSEDLVPEFLKKHISHLPSLCIADEHDPRYDSYQDFNDSLWLSITKFTTKLNREP